MQDHCGEINGPILAGPVLKKHPELVAGFKDMSSIFGEWVKWRVRLRDDGFSWFLLLLLRVPVMVVLSLSWQMMINQAPEYIIQ